jgi:hypothetical protein
MRDKDAHLMMEGLYKEQDPATAARAMGGQPQPQAQPQAQDQSQEQDPAQAQAQDPAQPAAAGDMIPYSILVRLSQDLEHMFTSGVGKIGPSGYFEYEAGAVKSTVMDFVRMAFNNARWYEKNHPKGDKKTDWRSWGPPIWY